MNRLFMYISVPVEEEITQVQNAGAQVNQEQEITDLNPDFDINVCNDYTVLEYSTGDEGFQEFKDHSVVSDSQGLWRYLIVKNRIGNKYFKRG